MTHHEGQLHKLRGMALLIVLAVAAGATPRAEAQTLATPPNSPQSNVATDGRFPHGTLVMDKAGNLYGTTEHGGTFDHGTVFKLDTAGHLTVLHSFSGPDGMIPEAGLLFDGTGNSFGTTWGGGSFAAGTVFKIDASGRETVLHSFNSFTDSDGASPTGAGLVKDMTGNLYGTTAVGGSAGYGTVFKLDTSGREIVLHSFTKSGEDGALPWAGLLIDGGGNLYGTTEQGGTSDAGTVFKLDKYGRETVLYSFTNSGGDGANPAAGVIMDAAGNLYGTTQNGGTQGCGTVFKLDTAGRETVLHRFSYSNGDGVSPQADLVMDTSGNLYGTTTYGGTFTGGMVISPALPGYGTLFKLDTSGREAILHSFSGSRGDGAYPAASLLMDAAGNLYGTTKSGGAFGYGTVFKLDATGHITLLHSFAGTPKDEGFARHH